MLQGYVYDDTFIADAAVSAYRVVVWGERGDVHEFAGKHVKLPGAADANGIVGITQHATTASGDTVLVRRAGVTKLTVASANVVPGSPLRVWDIRGNADAQVGLWASGDGIIGFSQDTSTASGDTIECWLAISMILGQA